jgi:two-component sensor histidine kinase
MVGARLALGRPAERPMAAGVAAATFIANVTGDRSAPLAATFAAINVIEFILVARIAEGFFGYPFRLNSLTRVAGFFLATCVGSGTAALAATFAIGLLRPSLEPAVDTWHVWFRSDAIGMIGIAPLLVALRPDASLRHPLSVHAEGVVTLTALSILAYVLFSVGPTPDRPWTQVPPVAALFPVLLLVAVRLPLVYACAAVTVLTVIVVVTTAKGIGRFSEPHLDALTRLISAQIFIVSAAVCSLALAALVAERRGAEAHQRLLISELDHRVKNSLAEVQAVVERSREGARSIEEFVASLGGRIRSMARTQAKLSSDRWHSLCLATLIGDELAPFRSPANTSLEGPPVRLKAQAAQPVSMVVHELATNAAKYGALSSPLGRVEVRWALESAATGEPVLKLAWREVGGPPVATPEVEGYGTRTIRELLPYELGATVDLTFAETGVGCEIALPASIAIASLAPSPEERDSA